MEKLTYKEEKLHINKTQYFAPIKKELWEYRIGGYQVLKKYLSDRKGRVLSSFELETFLKITKAIEETLRIQEKLLKTVPV